MIKVFISFCSANSVMVKYLEKEINAIDNFKAVIVPDINQSLKSNSEKVMKALNESQLFVCLKTSDSLENQWVNQELAYWVGKKGYNNMYVIVEKSIQKKLKGFITNEMDLQYRFLTEQEFHLAVKKLLSKLKVDNRHYGKYYIW